MNWLRQFSFCSIAVLTGLVLSFDQPSAHAQGTGIAKPSPPAKKLPAPQNVQLKTTRDGVLLMASYFPSPLEKQAQREAVPVILLHQLKGSRTDYNEFALALQRAGCAVLVPDLRGHGRSTRRITADGKPKTLDPKQLNKLELDAMADIQSDGGGDVDVCKSFLWQKNNEGELNIDKLVLVGAEMGATAAVNWAALDWSFEPVANIKQGKFAKSLVLLSPQRAFNGATINRSVANRDFISDIAWMIVVGDQDPKALDEAKRLHQILEKGMRTPPGPNLELIQVPTSLQGTKLLPLQNTTADILKFIDTQVAKSNHPWAERKNAL
jgi:hypothetical protein